MKKPTRLAPAVAAVLAAVVALAQGQEQPPPQSPPSAAQTPAAQRPPRIIGQPQSQEELDAWRGIEQASPETKTQLAHSYLEKFPESGLTPFVHQLLAFSYQQANDYEKFIFHAERSVEELPQNALLLSALAIAYAQKGQTDKAIDRAQWTLQALEVLTKPPQVPEADWIAQKDQLTADAYYALGSAHLNKVARGSVTAKPEEDSAMKEAVQNLEKAVELDPGHDRAYYHLGYAYGKQNDGQKSIEAYARATALGGVAQAPARDQLQRVYQLVHKNLQGLEDLINQQRAYCQQKIAEKQARLRQLQPTQPTAPPTPQP